MTEEKVPTISVNDVPDPISDLRNILNKQQAIILKQNEEIKSLTVRMNENEKLAAAAPAAEPQAAAEPKKSPQDEAYDAMLREMGINKEE